MEVYLFTSLRCSNLLGSHLPCVDTIPEETAVTVGNFDGFHKGHIHLVKKLSEEAKVRGLKTLLLTFFPHPLKILAPGLHFCEISDIYEKILIAGDLNIDYFVFIKFTKKFSLITAKDFLEEIIYKKLGCRFLLVGYDWRFGYGREGEIELAREVGNKVGFEVGYIEPYRENGKIVSSTLIRRLLKEGRLSDAEFFLGRKYWIERKVIKGEGRGKKMGFPTANIKNTKNLCLRRGVYAVRVNDKCTGVANYGLRPTFYRNSEDILEVHVLEKDESFLGKRMKIEFLEFLREEKCFTSISELKKQIEKDINIVIKRYK